jgi:prepilin-type processing-associated H-X9-DG protein
MTRQMTHSTNDENYYRVGFLRVHDGRRANVVFLDY